MFLLAGDEIKCLKLGQLKRQIFRLGAYTLYSIAGVHILLKRLAVCAVQHTILGKQVTVAGKRVNQPELVGIVREHPILVLRMYIKQHTRDLAEQSEGYRSVIYERARASASGKLTTYYARITKNVYIIFLKQRVHVREPGNVKNSLDYSLC